jgi:hypothetical protein
MFQFPGLLGYSGLDARWAAPPDFSQPSTPDLLMTPRHPPRALRSLTTPIGPPLLVMNPGEPGPLEVASTDTTGIFTEARDEPAQRLATRRPFPSFSCIRKGSFDTARATSRRAKPFSYCTVVEIATHPILRATRADRENPTHSPLTRVCVSCVTNTGLPKSTNLGHGSAGKADRDTGGSWSGQGARS